MLNLKSFAAVILAVGALSACSVESLVDDLNDAAIDSAFDVINQNAEALGGKAVKVKRGQEVTLEVVNPASPINGATVKIPAGAIPADYDLAALSIQNAPVIDGANEDVVLNGPGALVTLVSLPGLEAITPAVALTIALPITSTSTKPVEQIVLGSYDTSALALAAVDGSKGDDAKKQAVGDTTVLTYPFAASWKVDYTGGAAEENSLIYKVTKADSSVCVGYRALTDTNVQSGISDADMAGYQFTLALGLTNPVAFTQTQLGSYGTPPTSTSVNFVVDNTFQITCGGTAFVKDGAVTKDDLSFSNFVESSATTVAGGTNHVGSVKLMGEFDYMTAGGDHVQLSFDATKSDFNWFTNP